MITDPFLIIAVLLGIEALVLWLKNHPRCKRFFRFIPHVFWIYFLPMLAATAGLIDTKSPVYGTMTTYLLPACLFLLLLAVNIKAIMRLGGTALIMMSAGSLGIMLGTVAAFLLFKDRVGVEFASGFGALAGSWTGGSANMIAVKEAVGTPDRIFLPMVVVDTVVPYVWMGILVALVGWQGRFDRWTRARSEILGDLKGRMTASPPKTVKPLSIMAAGVLIILALGMSQAAQWIAGYCPQVPGILSAYTWTIIIITTLGVGVSFTRMRRLEDAGATKLGYFILYFVLTSIGARANLAELGAAVPLILAGFVILIIHAGVIILTARIIRAPLFLAAVSSQANVGGVASGPIVAEIYHSGFAPVGLLLAIFGNIVGTYLGIITAQLCHGVRFW